MSKHLQDLPLIESKQVREAKILAWIGDHPGATAKDVAMQLLGGPGESLSTERRQVRDALYALYKRGEVKRVVFEVPGTRAWGYRYWKNDSPLKLPPKAP